MLATTLGEIYDALACADQIGRTPWHGCAVYMLWDRTSGEPIYCGMNRPGFAGGLNS